MAQIRIKKSLVFAVLLISLCSVFAYSFVSCTGTLYNSQSAGTAVENFGAGTQAYGHRFQASANYIIYQVTAYANTTTASYNLRARIYSDNAGAVNALLGASTYCNVSTVLTWQQCNMTFASPISIINGDYYWIVLGGSTSANSKLLTASSASNDVSEAPLNSETWTYTTSVIPNYWIYGWTENRTNVLNVNVLDEQNGTSISADTIKINTYDRLTGFVSNLTTSSASSESYCLTENDTHYLDYNIEYAKDGYTTRTNYVLNKTSTFGSPANINLYSMMSTNDDEMKWRLLDAENNPESGYYVNLQRYDFGTASNYTVFVGISDSEGYITGFLEYYAPYFIKITDANGVTVYQSTQSKMYSIDDIGTTIVLNSNYTSWFVKSLVSVNTTFNDVTRLFSISAVDTRGVMTKLIFNATYTDDFGIVKTGCSEIKEGTGIITLYCNLTQNNTYHIIADAYYTDNTYLNVYNEFNDLSSAGYDFGKFGLLAAFFIIFLFSAMGLSSGHMGLTFIFTFIGIFVSKYFNLISFGWEYIIGVGILALFLVMRFGIK